MRERLWHRLRAWVKLDHQSLLAGGRDVYQTTRRSLLSIEARAGAMVFAGLWFLSQIQSPSLPPFPFDPGPAFGRLAEAAWLSLNLFRLLLFLLFLTVGAVLGIFVRHAWDLAEEFTPAPPRRGWPRRLRWSFTAAGILFLHGGFLLAALRAHPSLYRAAFHDRGGVPRLFQDWLAEGFLSFPGRLWSLLAVVVVLAGLAQMGRRFFGWFRAIAVPTRAATLVLGTGTILFLSGLWGVFRFHRPANTGPNIVVLSVEGLRTADLDDPERAPVLYELARRGRSFAACVPSVPQREASLMTLLTGCSPLSHGVRHAFPAGGDVALGPDSLPARLHRADFTVEAAADAGGDLLGRLSPAGRGGLPGGLFAGAGDGRFAGSSFDRVRAPDLSVPGVARRDILRRCVHLLPYLRGRAARRLLPTLRAVAELSDPRLLAEEGEGMLKQLRFQPRFFLLLDFSGGPIRRVDGAVGRILQVLGDLNLDDSTWVVLWSPFTSSGTEDVAFPGRFRAPLVVMGPLHRPAPRRVEAYVRDVDVAPTLLSAVGVPVPEAMEGLPLFDVDTESPGFRARDVYTESNLWAAPDESPLPPDARLAYGPPADWLEEDPEADGRLRIRPAAEDAVLSYRHRFLQTGKERLVYRPSRKGVLFEYYDLASDPGAKTNLAATRSGAERVKELKEVLFQELRRETGWRPQNDFWIPEAFMRRKE